MSAGEMGFLRVNFDHRGPLAALGTVPRVMQTLRTPGLGEHTFP